MGRKGKRVHEQSVGSSAQAFDYETIRIYPNTEARVYWNCIFCTY